MQRRPLFAAFLMAAILASGCDEASAPVEVVHNVSDPWQAVPFAAPG
ncbi:MAG: hypothetical protein H0V73_10785 [Chloroflexi bacterium]|nr:hypothetical protein [Chloroflexota bacterium]